MKNVLFAIAFLFFLSCDEKNDDSFETAPSPEIQALIDKGVTVDSISIAYATQYQSTDNFPVIKPNPINEFEDKNEILIYFDFKSGSRETLKEYFSELAIEKLDDGYIYEYIISYYDKIENISVEIKKNDEEFYKLKSDSDRVKLIPAPELTSQHTFARYEHTIEEFSTRYANSFPEYVLISFDEKETKANSYIFRVTFEFNNDKTIVVNSKEILF
ncbi:MAG: hypothetical protein COA80_09300 [Leeuwenhoekiella sp.]|uniref:Uncharacterized protein n=1 Tax=Leeuwenhoekiella nanhaiensis TaxID=1655491 RepID=A0A2G1VUE5_9FLAO|nr:hypothetical protein [Leeuwenhoekiella nanhaiensis]PHQ30408.1 hypothetical protein CJ305_05470 [Leeuwenhoekiella nanhaiensis]PHR96114.1 MAG: hypothetical protein COA80_09300 [Leeuwenhoekiella sp.]